MSLKFGAYEILHELKAGGMGAVLLGRRRGPGSFEQLVAIKTIRSEYAAAPAVRAMFLDEAAIVARIHHPVIATVHDFGDQDGELYMVMEYVAGNSFRALADAAMPPTAAARAIADACRGLHAAHEVRDTTGALMGVVHRDISPDNLMLGFDGHVKVIDFGIALVKNRQSPVTEFGTVKGKPPYMSPEQVKNEPIDRRSDVFSLGVVLHELLTGKPLFDGDSIYAIARAVEHHEIQAPSLVRGEPLPPGLDAAVMRALIRDPAHRTQTAAAFAEELERVVANTGDESLEAWADRELAEPRETHRNWIAAVVMGKDTPRPIGRATGAATAVAPIKAPTPNDPDADAVASPASASPASSAPAPLVANAPPPPRASRWPLLALLLPVIAVIFGIVMVLSTPPEQRDVVRDATAVIAADAPAADAAPVAPVDAAVVALPDATASDDAAASPADAVAVRRDAGSPRDAVITSVRIDAPPKPVAIDAAPVAKGTGLVSFRAKRGSYVNVTLDGQSLGPTPIFKHPVNAGSHSVEMRDPVGNLVHKTTFVVDDGELENITQP